MSSYPTAPPHFAIPRAGAYRLAVFGSGLLLGVLALLGGPGLVWGAPAAAKTSLGKLTLQAWDARRDVQVKSVEVFRQGCDLTYRFDYERQKSFPIKLRLLLSLDAGPASVATLWADSRQVGVQVVEDRVRTEGCWIKRAKSIGRATLEVVGDEPRPPARAGRDGADGREFLGKVTFERWGSSGDVYYRHIQTWRKGCNLHYQFLYKRNTSVRRRIQMSLTFDNGTLKTPWVRSKEKGWREIVGELPTPDCWGEKTTTLRTAAFESERF